MKNKLDIFFDYLWGTVFMVLLGSLLAFVYVMKTGGF
jgi:hypothetical protein